MRISTSGLRQQFIPVNGIINARDLGGYIIQDGRRLRDGMLIRSAHLADATDEDLQYLLSIPISKVIDFRKDIELNGKTDRMVPGAEYIRLEIDASGKIVSQATEDEKRLFTGHKQFDIKKFMVMAAFNSMAQRIAQEMYPNLFFDPECQEQFREFFRLILETEKGAILYHCTQGKDRTGAASALILAALGADRETIIADFDATNRVYEADVRRCCRNVRLMGGKETELATVKSFLGANTENFIKVLDRIDREFGTMEAYLKGPIGLTDQDILTLRERYLEK
ncbi:MAG: tyrosine-protein phosphatase [Bacteroidaceae bacterium]|nr:tyrosine-protein phosphatase [Bacteroidaceae bacterium]